MKKRIRLSEITSALEDKGLHKSAENVRKVVEGKDKNINEHLRELKEEWIKVLAKADDNLETVRLKVTREAHRMELLIRREKVSKKVKQTSLLLLKVSDSLEIANKNLAKVTISIRDNF